MTVHTIINSAAGGQGGAEHLARRLHGALLEGGMDARLVGLCGPAPELAHTTHLGRRSPYAPSAPLALARHVARTVKPGDTVHAHLFPTVAYLAALRRMGRLSGVRLVFTEHNTSNRRRDHPLGRAVDRAIYRQLDTIVAISDGVAEALGAWMPAVAGRIRVIPNGVAPAFVAPIDRPPRPRPRVVSLGNLRYTKNYPIALDAVALLSDLDFEYVIAGEGPDRPQLQARIEHLGLSDKVRLAGYVDAPSAFLEAADVFLMPSIVEGFGLAAVEAMNASLPVVAADVPGLREVLGDGLGETPCGRLVDPANPAAIAAALREMLTVADRAALGWAAFARAAAFTEAAMMARHLDLYREGS